MCRALAAANVSFSLHGWWPANFGFGPETQFDYGQFLLGTADLYQDYVHSW